MGAGAAVTRPFTDAEFTRRDLKDIVMTVGYATKLPSRQLWQTGEYFFDWYVGDLEPESLMQGLWQGVVTGRPR